MGQIVFEIRRLMCRYPESDSNRPALSDIHLDLNVGDFAVVSGPNGAGKTTLLNCISGVIPKLIPAEVEGSVQIYGRSVESYEMPELARTVGVVLEDPDSQIFGSTVIKYLAFGLELMGFSRDKMLQRIGEAAEQMSIAELLDRRCHSLSGGEKQRVVVTSMLVMRPSIMVLDEPTSQLDPAGTRDLFAALGRLNREFGMTILVASHNLSELSEIGTHLIILDEGRIRASGSFSEVLRQPLQQIIRYPQATELYNECKARSYCVDSPPPVTINQGVEFVKSLAKPR